MSNRLKKYPILVFLIASVASSQAAGRRAVPLPASAPTSIIRDATALTVVQSAIDSMGGLAAAAGIRSAIAKGTASSVGTVGPVSDSNFIWEDTFNGTPEFRRETEKSGQRTVFVSNHGAPRRGTKDVVKALPHHVALATSPLYVPAIFLARVLSNTQYSMTIPKQDDPSSSARRVEIALETDFPTHEVTLQDWYFDAVTNLPIKVEYRRINARNARDYKLATAEFSDYRVVAGVTTPFAVKTQTKEIHDLTMFAVTTIDFNVPTRDSDFETR